MPDACCAVGARPDADAIDAALRAGGPDASVRKVAERFGLGKTAVSNHRACLGLRGSSPGATPSADTADAEPRTPADSGKDSADSDRPPPSPRTIFDAPNPGDDRLTAPRKLVTAEVERRCVDLRVRGKNYEDIAAEVGIHWETAMDAVERVLLRTRGKADALAEQAREIELRRCDAIIESFWERATDPAMATVDVPADTESGVRAYDGQDKAADRLLKAMERRAKLLGLDAPSTAIMVNIAQHPEAQIHAKRQLAALMGAVLLEAPEAAGRVAARLRAWNAAVATSDELALRDPRAWMAAQPVLVEAQGADKALG